MAAGRFNREDLREETCSLGRWRRGALDEATKQLKLSRRTLQRWLSKGLLTPYKILGNKHIHVGLDQVRKIKQTTAAVTQSGSGLRAGTGIVLVHDPAADLVSAEARISVASSPVELESLAVPDILQASKPLSYRVVKNGKDWNSAPLADRTVALYYGFKACQVHGPGARLTVRRILPHLNAAALHGWEQPSSVVHVARSLARGSARTPVPPSSLTRTSASWAKSTRGSRCTEAAAIVPHGAATRRASRPLMRVMRTIMRRTVRAPLIAIAAGAGL